ncbi:hypothetical protein [Maricaulis sp.]|uniref:hypothetical protein n=1 Tax=unclassified Maricaulis TaxID=2632371 RepID=UPI001B24FA31|nr:hypothetical protein [Maricaulis sp.]MBO6795871.1 hypothetical protein [Maricaulis sp.]
MSGLFRLIALAGGIGLTALIWWAVVEGDFGAAGDWLFNHPWGIVTLADLYLGFLFMAGVIALVERTWFGRIFWILPIFVLGNVWPALWLIVNAGKLVRTLRESSKN